MKILVVGAGATGGYFGGRLAEAGRDVTFLVRPGRAAKLSKTGLQITSPLGDVTVMPKIATTDSLDGRFDAILMTVKAYTLDAAMADVAPAVGPETMILPFLNGMRHMDVLAERFGPTVPLPCVCKIGSTLDEDGRIVHFNKLSELVYGEADGKPSERTIALDKVMQGAKFDAKLSPAVMQEMWQKWTMLATIGAATCMMRGTIGEIEAAPGGTDFVLALLEEVLAVVRKVGVAPADAFVETVRRSLNQKGSPQAPSMYRDLQSGASVEADQIVGDMVARGRAAGIPTPLLAAAYANLSVYQARRDAGAA